MKKTYLSVFNLTFLIFLFYAWNYNGTDLPTQKETKQNTTCIMVLPDDRDINLGDSVVIEVITNCPQTDALSIVWTPGDYLSCTDCWEQSVTPLEDICYTVTINWIDGCVTSEETCIYLPSCPEISFSENQINSISPQEINNEAEIELEIAQFQYVHFEIVDDGEVKYTIWEGWMGAGLTTRNLDFSNVPAGNHELRARLYPENRYIDITKL